MLIKRLVIDLSLCKGEQLTIPGTTLKHNGHNLAGPLENDGDLKIFANTFWWWFSQRLKGE